MVKPSINSQKHINMIGPATTTAGAVTVSTFVEGVEIQNKNTQVEVAEGAVVKAIWVEFWETSDDTAQGSFSLSIEKLPAGAPSMTFAQSIALGTYPNKKNVLYITRGLVGPTTGATPTPVIRNWVMIPKGKQRFGLGDKLNINFTAIANGITHCGFVLFKEYY